MTTAGYDAETPQGPDFVKFRLKNNQEVSLSIEVAKLSKRVSSEIQIKKSNNDVFEQPTVSLPIFTAIKEYMEYHARNGVRRLSSKPLRSKEIDSLLDEWDLNFMKRFNMKEIYLIMHAADDERLQVTSLYNLCCCWIAHSIRGKSNLQIKQLLDVRPNRTWQGV